MRTLVIMSLVVILWLVVILALRKTANRPKQGPSKRRAKKSNLHAAVSIVFDKDKACPEVTELLGQRFLVSEAPKLPLPDCSVKRCSCSFHRYSDRRQKVMQRGVIEQPYAGTQQRGANRGRRLEDMPGEIDRGALDQDFPEEPEAKTYFGHHDKTGSF